MVNGLAKVLPGKTADEEEMLELLAFNEKMAELGKMAAGVVHELNTPLSVIVSATQMILREEGLSDFVREMVDRINLEANRLAELTKGVLTFTRREGGGGEETDVNQVMREVLAFLRYEAQKRSIAILEDLDFRLPYIAAEANRIKQIFINLVMNAIQAMGHSGKLFLRSSRGPESTVMVQITDTGMGIPAEIVEHLFTPFFTTKGPGEGTGLGLYVTKRLLDAIGGTIAVQSAVGEGTTFTLTFPVAE
ncbi:two-component sensor histidine kinase [Geotalea uraniireducens]|uniref:histidine kinase n=1 Tax=Geotalea uraniireducens TaxID=351604 RepID=A0ABM8EHW9_9BACT|nr:HAMP domain-containing sensor histidine kinase [Geotalea uraniireducens]BDV42032.1 two-component sensor histidine kinase [Geotalea uraniireducens]